jgi:hypothetical protein
VNPELLANFEISSASFSILPWTGPPLIIMNVSLLSLLEYISQGRIRFPSFSLTERPSFDMPGDRY